MSSKSHPENPLRLSALVASSLVLIAGTYFGMNTYVNSVINANSGSSTTILPFTASERQTYARSDVFTKAQPLHEGITLGTLKVSDADYYTFNVTTPSDAHINLHNLPNVYELTLYTPNKDVITNALNNGPSGDDIGLSLQPGEYFLRIYIYNNAGNYSSRPYTLEFSLTPTQARR